jgi:hypothetical protein
MSAQPEVWRVSTVEGIFETDLETLKQWIVEGCVLPTDKVSKGNLSWIDAGRVPKLKGAFNGEIDPPAQQTETASVQGGWQTPPAYEGEESFDPPPTASTSSTANSSHNAATKSCHNHPDATAKYICRMCATTLCEQCPRFVGSSKIPVCPLCGDLCRSYEEVTTRIARAEFQDSGFGWSDFLRAVRYPLQHKAALIGGALLYGFLILAGLRGTLVAWMIMFGCISHVISQVAWGRLDRSFMPDFSAFSLWDDLVVPVFLAIGIAIVSWGPVIVLVLALFFGAISGGVGSSLGPTGGMHSGQQDTITSDELDTLMDPDADPKKVEEANRKLYQLRPGAQLAKDAERSKSEHDDPAGVLRQLMPVLGAGFIILVLTLMGLAWGLFYYPMALTVAGYTQSFSSVVNPLVGLDTIRRMRSTYFKAFGMVLIIQFAAFIVGGIVAFITSPLTLPFVGNLLANVINGSITFYFNLVIACVLGLSLYKCADRLEIAVD